MPSYGTSSCGVGPAFYKKFAAWIVTAESEHSERYAATPRFGHPMIFEATAALSMELAQEDGVAPASTWCAGELRKAPSPRANP